MIADKTGNEDPRQRALAKLQLELKKDIARAEAVASNCGIWELLRLCYGLRLSRHFAMHPSLRDRLTKAQKAELQLEDEASIYAINLVAKSGSWADECNLVASYTSFNEEIVEELLRHARHINAKFETQKLLNIVQVKVSGDRDQEAFVDLNMENLEPDRKKYLYYGLRLERQTSDSKEKFKSIQELVVLLRDEVMGLEEQFESQFGISINRYCDGLLELQSELEVRWKAAFEKYDENNAGVVDFEDAEIFESVGRMMVFTDNEIKEKLNSDFGDYLRSHPFSPSDATNDELRFHYLTRRPFLVGRGFVVLSPELCFDSVFDNLRFTLLEGIESKNEYKAAASSRFIDQIAAAAESWGYKEVERDFYLRQGKSDYGDLDLVLFNDNTQHTLLIEAKNHALPLAVYFGVPGAIDEHVKRSMEWSEKVGRRIAHLRSNSSCYKIDNAWDYIIVSRMAEPLAHYSDLLVLSLEEFKLWIASDSRESKFDDFYQRLYQIDRPTMNMDEIRELTEKGYSLLRPESWV